MKTETKSSKELSAEVFQDLQESVNVFLDEFAKKTRDLSSFLTMDQLETMFSELDSKTRKIYLDMVSDSLTSIDETDIIRSKKAN